MVLEKTPKLNVMKLTTPKFLHGTSDSWQKVYKTSHLTPRSHEKSIWERSAFHPHKYNHKYNISKKTFLLSTPLSKSLRIYHSSHWKYVNLNWPCSGFDLNKLANSPKNWCKPQNLKKKISKYTINKQDMSYSIYILR